MTLQDLSWVVILNGVVQLAGLLVILVIGIRHYRELVRLDRAIAGLVYQESEKTRAYLDQFFAARPK